MDLERDVFPLLLENEYNLMIKKPEKEPSEEDEEGEYPSNRKPRPEDWMIEGGTRDAPPSWSDFRPYPLGGQNDLIFPQHNDWGEYFPRGGLPGLSPIQPVPNDNGDGYRFPNDAELKTEWIEDEIEASGIDALAWYRPFHINPQHKWGITITDRGVWYIAREMMSKKYKEPYTEDEIQDCFDLATDFLYQHEMFHFKVELAATLMELNGSGQPTEVYARYWDHRRAGPWFGSPSDCLDGAAPLEEALANEYARHKVCRGQPKPLKRAVEKFVREEQPDGYRHYYKVKHNLKWRQGLTELVNKMLDRETPLGRYNLLDSDSILDTEEVVPCQFLNSEMPMSFEIRALQTIGFCRTKKFERDLKKLTHQVRVDMERACDDWMRDRCARRNPKIIRGIKKPRIVAEFRVGRSPECRAYHEKINGERILRRIGKKTEGSQKAIVNALKKQKHPGKITSHDASCGSAV